MKICILAEHDNQELKHVNAHVVTAALQLGDKIDVIILGNKCEKVVHEASKLQGVERVLVADNPVYEHQLAENCALLLAEIAKDYDYFLAPSSTFGKNILPRVASLLDVAMISDATKILAPDTFLRPMYAGNIIAKIQSEDKIKIITIRTTAFPAANAATTNTPTVEEISKVIPNPNTRFEKQTLTTSARPELTAARVIVSGGRGLKSAENFKLLEKIADLLGAAIGASRAAVDAGFAPNDYQVGQTGKVVAPDLYIAVGISGAIQHLAGMKDSKVIVAINNDPEAPIFQIADYRLVGDLFKILPELQDALEKTAQGKQSQIA